MERFRYEKPFALEAGGSLDELEISYTTYGALNADRSNVIWICHALTANSDVQDWWPGMVGEGTPFDSAKYFIVCANILGSCYGTTGPLSAEPGTGEPYYHRFPFITIRDMVKAHRLLREYLGIARIHLLVGGSMGGYQAMEWMMAEPGIIDRLMLIASSPRETPWGVAIHTAQRMAIEADASWSSSTPEAGMAGLRTARAIAMVTYRNPAAFELTQTDPDPAKLDEFRASSYIRYQGEKLARRFNAFSYYRLSKAMDSHNICRGRDVELSAALGAIKVPVLFIAIDSDLLFPLKGLQDVASLIRNCEFHVISSAFGHDGFLTEVPVIAPLVSNFLQNTL